VKEAAKQPPTVNVGREAAGRRVKGVTTVFGVPLDEIRFQQAKPNGATA
jgi:hypothetical protein